MLKSKSSRWLAGPYLVWMAIFTVVPLFIVIWYAISPSTTSPRSGGIPACLPAA